MKSQSFKTRIISDDFGRGRTGHGGRYGGNAVGQSGFKIFEPDKHINKSIKTYQVRGVNYDQTINDEQAHSAATDERQDL
jgi:hypothetical protein